MLGAHDNEDNYSFIDIAYIIKKHGAQPDKDCEELWRRVIFGLMISNTDNHLRNHGFLFNGKGWILSPVYDINPNNSRLNFSVSIDIEKPNDINTALEHISKFRLSKSKAKEILEEVKIAVAQWRQTAKFYDIPAKEIERMKTAFLV